MTCCNCNISTALQSMPSPKISSSTMMMMVSKTLIGTAVIITLFSLATGDLGCRLPGNGSLALASFDDVFVENKTSRFLCFYDGGRKHFSLRWFLKDQKRNISAFEHDVTGMNKIHKNKDYLLINIVMRREFTGMDLICASSTGEKRSIFIPEVKKSIPFKVNFSGSDLTLGSFVHIWCDVKTNLSFNYFAFRDDEEYYSATSHCNLSDGWVRYEFKNDYRVKKAMDRVPMQCGIVSSNPYDCYGNVFSSIKRLTVHFFSFGKSSWKNVTVTFGARVSWLFRVDANPEPTQANFRIEKMSGAKIKSTTSITPLKGTKYAFDVKMEFIPLSTSAYRVSFRGPKVKLMSPSFYVTVKRAVYKEEVVSKIGSDAVLKCEWIWEFQPDMGALVNINNIRIGFWKRNGNFVTVRNSFSAGRKLKVETKEELTRFEVSVTISKVLLGNNNTFLSCIFRDWNGMGSKLGEQTIKLRVINPTTT